MKDGGICEEYDTMNLKRLLLQDSIYNTVKETGSNN